MSNFKKNWFKNKKILERTALTCPVGKSLSNEINQVISFIYPDE